MIRVTPDKIHSLEPNQIYVFRSNTAGAHGAGTAKLAKTKFGAKLGKGEGLQGTSYAIPTRGYEHGVVMYTLPLTSVQRYVDNFITFAIDNPGLTFLVTEIGCEEAEFSVEDIAPLFKGAKHIKNIHLPQSFWEILNQDK